MGEVINLRQARKDRKRAEKAQKAKQNRTVHGRTKAEKVRSEDDAARANRELDSKKLD